MFNGRGLLCVLLILSAGCSKQEDLPEATRQLDTFLAAPQAGEGFSDFIDQWEAQAPLEKLAPQLVEEKGHAVTPAETAAVILTQALLAVEQGEAPKARARFNELAEAPGFPELLSREFTEPESPLISDLLDAIESAYLDKATAAGLAHNLDATTEAELWKTIEAIATSTRCLWPLHVTLAVRPWADEARRSQILPQIAAYRIADRFEQVHDFLLFSPLVAPVSDFDPVALLNQERKTLLELLLYRFNQAGLKYGAQLAKLLRSSSPDEFGATLMATQLENPPGPLTSAATATWVQGHLGELSGLSEERQQDLAALISRLTGHLSGADLKPDGKLASFHSWLAEQGESNAGLTLASSWLTAETWDELPCDPYEVFPRVIEILDPLIARDPAVASKVVVHINRLREQSLDPDDERERRSHGGDTLLTRFIHERKTGASCAFAINTFVAADGEFGYAMGPLIDDYGRITLAGLLYQAKRLEPRYVDFYASLRDFTVALDIEDERLLIGPLRAFSNRLPINDVKVVPFLERLESEVAANNDEDFAKVLDQLRAAVQLRNRALTKAPKLADAPEEAPYLEAIRDTNRNWQWRFAIASSLLNTDYGPMSDDFVRASADLLIEGHHDNHVFLPGAEQAIVSALHQLTRKGKDDDLRQGYLEAWSVRLEAVKRTAVDSEVRASTIQMALDAGNEKVARRIITGFSSSAKSVSTFIAAINAGAIDLAWELIAARHENYRYPPDAAVRSPDFDRHTEAFLQKLDSLPDSAAGLERFDRDIMALLARSVFYVTPKRTNTPASKVEAQELAALIAAAYRDHDVPPAPVEQALLLLANDNSTLALLSEPLERWMQLCDIEALFRDGSEIASAQIQAIRHYARWRIGKGNGRDSKAVLDVLEAANSVAMPKLDRYRRNEFFDELLQLSISSFRASTASGEDLSAEKLDDWIKLLRAFSATPKTLWDSRKRGGEFPNLIAACALAGRGSELDEWWQRQAPDHQKFLGGQASTGLGSVFNATGRLAKGSKSMQADPELRKRFAIGVLQAPQPAAGTDFAGPWIYRGLATAEELLEWAPDLIAGAEQRGCTAYLLAKMTRDRMEQPEQALALFDQALASEKKYHSDELRFRIEKARTLGKLGRAAEGVAELETYRQSSRFVEKYTAQVDKATAELEALQRSLSPADPE